MRCDGGSINISSWRLLVVAAGLARSANKHSIIVHTVKGQVIKHHIYGLYMQ